MLPTTKDRTDITTSVDNVIVDIDGLPEAGK